MSHHLDDVELREFVRHTLPADRVLAVDDHLTECEACRTRAAAIGDVSTALSEVTDELGALESDDDLPAVESAPFIRTSTAHTSSYRYLSLAAAVTLVVLAPFAVSRWWPAAPSPAVLSLPGMEQLGAGRRALVEAALERGSAEAPPTLTDLVTQREVLMGQNASPAFALIAPLMTVTPSDRPTFRWEAMAGADDYTIAVFDADLQTVSGPTTLTQTTWTPPQALPRDRVYIWQVTARRGTESVTVPMSPQPFARFRIMDAETAAEIDTLTRLTPQPHLVLGLALTQAGARQDALDHLRQVQPTDRHAAVAERTVAHLESIVRPR